MHDLIAAFEQASRRVADTEVNDAPAHVVELRRALHAPVGDVWDACTNPERVRRWFLPLSGDLQPGGSFQLEGNAGGRHHRMLCSPRSGLSELLPGSSQDSAQDGWAAARNLDEPEARECVND